MIYDLSADILDIDGSTVPIKIKRAGKEVTVNLSVQKLVVDGVLMSEKEPLSGAENVRRHLLAKRCYQKSKVELTHEDCVFIKDQVTKLGYGPLVVGQIYEALEEKSEVTKVDKQKAK